MVATRGRTFKRPWRRSCLNSKLKSSSAPIGPKDSWCFHAVGSSSAPLLGSTAAEGLPRIGRTSIARRSLSCASPQFASCSENFVIPPDVFGQTLILKLGDADSCCPRHHRDSHCKNARRSNGIWESCSEHGACSSILERAAVAGSCSAGTPLPLPRTFLGSNLRTS